MYGYICEDCGAHLDPGEKCDCVLKKEMRNQRRSEANAKAEGLLKKSIWEQKKLEFCR